MEIRFRRIASRNIWHENKSSDQVIQSQLTLNQRVQVSLQSVESRKCNLAPVAKLGSSIWLRNDAATMSNGRRYVVCYRRPYFQSLNQAFYRFRQRYHSYKRRKNPSRWNKLKAAAPVILLRMAASHCLDNWDEDITQKGVTGREPPSP